VGRAASEGTQALSAGSVASGALAGPPAEALSGVLLAAVLITAITRPKRLPEAVVAVPAAAVVILTGALPLDQARDEAGRLLPVLAFLGAILVVAHVCQRDGLFSAAGARLARLGSPVRLLRGVFGLAAMTTALLSLDTTVVRPGRRLRARLPRWAVRRSRGSPCWRWRPHWPGWCSPRWPG
jgi:hypothetical protein